MSAWRPVVVRAVEALADGDTGYAVELLTNLIEQDGEHRIRARCPDCGHGAEWPGLLWQHTCLATREARRAA